MKPLILKQDLLATFRELGIQPGMTVMEHSAVMENGQRVWKAYDTLYVDGKDFAEIGNAFEAVHTVSKVKLGNATLRLMRQRELVDFAVRWIETNRE